MKMYIYLEGSMDNGWGVLEHTEHELSKDSSEFKALTRLGLEIPVTVFTSKDGQLAHYTLWKAGRASERFYIPSEKFAELSQLAGMPFNALFHERQAYRDGFDKHYGDRLRFDHIIFWYTEEE